MKLKFNKGNQEITNEQWYDLCDSIFSEYNSDEEQVKEYIRDIHQIVKFIPEAQKGINNWMNDHKITERLSMSESELVKFQHAFRHLLNYRLIPVDYREVTWHNISEQWEEVSRLYSTFVNKVYPIVKDAHVPHRDASGAWISDSYYFPNPPHSEWNAMLDCDLKRDLEHDLYDEEFYTEISNMRKEITGKVAELLDDIRKYNSRPGMD